MESVVLSPFLSGSCETITPTNIRAHPINSLPDMISRSSRNPNMALNTASKLRIKEATVGDVCLWPRIWNVKPPPQENTPA